MGLISEQMGEPSYTEKMWLRTHNDQCFDASNGRWICNPVLQIDTIETFNEARLAIDDIGSFVCKQERKMMTFHNCSKTNASVNCIVIYGESKESIAKLEKYILAKIEQDNPACRSNKFLYSPHKGMWSELRATRLQILYKDVVLPKKTIDCVRSVIDSFIKSEAEYRKYAIPYKLIILMHGTKRSGKSRLCEAIANELKRPIYELDGWSVASAIEAFQKIPEKSVILVNECDVLLKKYTDEKQTKKKSSEKQKKKSDEDVPVNVNVKHTLLLESDVSKDSQAYLDLLKIFDGTDGYIHDKIILMTTNHREALDERLLRRVNAEFEFELCSLEQVKDICAYRDYAMPEGFFEEGKDCQFYMDRITQEKFK